MDKISYQEARKAGMTFVDTRSPGEYEIDQIPGSVNIPIFNNDERAIVGTLYKNAGHDNAFIKGKAIYEQKIADIKNQLLEYKTKELCILCWRGGMRSKTIVELAVELGINCKQLTGGYKTYRKHVREQLADYSIRQKVVVLYGLTGTGKTDLINLFKDSIDLEGLAQHRSSVYGAIGLRPRSQKMFESLLLNDLENLSGKYLLLEGESRKIGNIIVPDFLYKAMNKGIGIEVTASMNTRVKRLVSIYACPESIAELTKITGTMKQKLGTKTLEKLNGFLASGKTDSFMQELLEIYYDPLYSHTNKERNYEFSVSTDDLADAAESLRRKYSVRFK